MGAGAGLRGERREPLGRGSVCCGGVDNTRLVTDLRSLEKMDLVNYLSLPLSWKCEALCSGVSLRARAECRASVPWHPEGLWVVFGKAQAGRVTWILVSVYPQSGLRLNTAL